MSKVKDFILQKKMSDFRKSIKKGTIPEQGSYINLYNNSYKILTKPDAKIAILEDSRSNKFAYSQDAFLKMLNESTEDKVEKADHYGSRPNKLVGHIGQNMKPGTGGASASSGSQAQVKADPVGTVRNGRKKVVSKKTGQTMWVNISTGESHSEHNSHETQGLSDEAKQQSKSFFDSIGDKLHPSDKIKLERQMNEVLQLKQRIQNSLDMTHQDERQKLPEAQISRKQVFGMQDKYKHALQKFQESVKESAAKVKKESGNEA